MLICDTRGEEAEERGHFVSGNSGAGDESFKVLNPSVICTKFVGVLGKSQECIRGVSHDRQIIRDTGARLTLADIFNSKES